MQSSQNGNPGNRDPRDPRFTFAPPGTRYEVRLFPDKFVPGALCGMVNDGPKEGKIVAIENKNPLNVDGDVVMVELVGETFNLIHARIVSNPQVARREAEAAIKAEELAKAAEAAKQSEIQATIKRQAEYKSRLAKEAKEKAEVAQAQAVIREEKRLDAIEAERKAQREEALARETRAQKELEAFMATLTTDGKKMAYIARSHDWYFGQSDDLSVYRAGQEQTSRLLALVRDLCRTAEGEAEARRIWDRFSEGAMPFPENCVPRRVAVPPAPAVVEEKPAPQPDHKPFRDITLDDLLRGLGKIGDLGKGNA